MDSSYGDVLRVAVEAAGEAGDLLRQDFLKPGGPSGHGGHAEADERAEVVIRRRLLAATPDWGYRGEETAPGGIASADGHHIWFVDPNDGTHAYLKGFRGSAVSIALLRDGTPVLGVVYAFAAPDNRGDFFAWAEGCGPLQRNGTPVERPPWATSLSPDTVILVSQDADHATAANLACVAPGRYLTVPGIAYRLALAAVGDGEVGVSLNRPGDWDYAGGHALLRGAGGMLIDQDVAPVTYTVSGDSDTRSCFGGAPALLGNIARRPWATALAHEAETEESLALCWPERGQTISDSDLLERAQGCLLGQLAGDALGSMVEFQGAAVIGARHPGGLRDIGPSPVFGTLAGQPTDDSELALALARTLLRDGAFVEDSVAAAYGYWRRSGPFDVGGTIGAATEAILKALERGESPATAARAAANTTSEANGALMRQSPLAVWGHALAPAALDAHARADTTLTHPNRVCQDASAAYLVALAAVIREGLDAMAAYNRARAWDREHGASPTVTAALEAAAHVAPAYERKQGHVLIALQNAFYQALHAPSVEEGIIATVMGGGDTDTNAAIAGALLGAIHGERAIPSRWRQAALTCRPQRGAQGVDQPRPRGFWPVDALYLAERLTATGAQDAASIVTAPEVFIAGAAGASASSLGSRTAARVVADVSDMPHDPRGAASGPDPASRRPGRTHFVGALLGGAMGDALGRPVEGLHPAEVRARYGRLTSYQKWSGWKEGPVGTITDDTQMTICVAESLTANGFLDPEDLARRFVAWLPHGRGKGRTTTEAVERLQRGEPWYRAGDDSSGSAPAMRAAPVGLLYWDDPARLRVESILSALPTHRQPMGVAGAVAMASATAWLLTRGAGVWEAHEFIAAVQAAIAGIEFEPLSERRNPIVKTTLYDRIGLIPDLLTREPDEVFMRLYNGAYVLECLPAALYCFLRSPTNVEESLLLAVNRGFDADTVAAMAGTLGGALGGVDALPQQLLHDLEYRGELTALAKRLYGLAIYGDDTRLSEDMQTEFGHMIPNNELTEGDIPAPGADWPIIIPFALAFDGYQYWGSFERCFDVAERHWSAYKRDGSVPSARLWPFAEERRQAD